MKLATFIQKFFHTNISIKPCTCCSHLNGCNENPWLNLIIKFFQFVNINYQYDEMTCYHKFNNYVLLQMNHETIIIYYDHNMSQPQYKSFDVLIVRDNICLYIDYYFTESEDDCYSLYIYKNSKIQIDVDNYDRILPHFGKYRLCTNNVICKYINDSKTMDDAFMDTTIKSFFPSYRVKNARSGTEF